MSAVTPGISGNVAALLTRVAGRAPYGGASDEETLPSGVPRN